MKGGTPVYQEVPGISKAEVRAALKRMKNGRTVGPDDIPVEVWKCLRETGLEFLARLFHTVLENERIPEEWRNSVLVPIFKNKGDVQRCSNYRGINLMSHTVNVLESVVEARLRKVRSQIVAAKVKGKICKMIVRPALLHGLEMAAFYQKIGGRAGGGRAEDA